MIALRRAADRPHDGPPEQPAWDTFYPQGEPDPLAKGFGMLHTIREVRLSPQSGVLEPRQDVEILTYVREGTLTYEDSIGRLGVLHASEFQRMTAGRGISYSETNASRLDWAHVFQVWLRPTVAGLEPGHEQKRFSISERRGSLCVVASPDGRNGSLVIHQDAVLYSAILDEGQHVVHPLKPARCAWLHVVAGAVTLNSHSLTAGDGAGITDEPAISVTAVEEAEILLLELSDAAKRSSRPRLPRAGDFRMRRTSHGRIGGD